MEGDGEWQSRKHGGSKRHIWRKIHFTVDEQTLDNRAVEATSSTIGDASVLHDLLNQIAPQERFTCVTADGGFGHASLLGLYRCPMCGGRRNKGRL